MNDNALRTQVLFEQLEYADAPDAEALRWDGQAWIGNDSYRLWLRSEGDYEDGSLDEGRHEIFYGRPLGTYFDWRTGVRYDADSGPGRGWAALGVQGLAPYFFEVSATAYAGSSGHFAANVEGAFDLLLTQRLILQPQAELNLYSKNDPGRGIGSGVSDIEAGLRLRYEVVRKFAPYMGVSYSHKHGTTRSYAVAAGEDPDLLRLVFGLYAWI